MKTNPDHILTYVSVYEKGLTKREYFAAMIAQGIWSNPESIAALEKAADVSNHSMSGKEKIAKLSIKAADALISALNEESQG